MRNTLIHLGLCIFPIIYNVSALAAEQVTIKSSLMMTVNKPQSVTVQGTTVHEATSVTVLSAKKQALREVTAQPTCKPPAKKGATGSCDIKLTIIKEIPLGQYTLQLVDAKKQVLAKGVIEIKEDPAIAAKKKQEAAALAKQEAEEAKKAVEEKTKAEALAKQKAEAEKEVTAKETVVTPPAKEPVKTAPIKATPAPVAEKEAAVAKEITPAVKPEATKEETKKSEAKPVAPTPPAATKLPAVPKPITPATTTTKPEAKPISKPNQRPVVTSIDIPKDIKPGQKFKATITATDDEGVLALAVIYNKKKQPAIKNPKSDKAASFDIELVAPKSGEVNIQAMALDSKGTKSAVKEEMVKLPEQVAEAKPEPTSPPAPAVTYAWHTSDWSQCSKVCGGGTQTRTVQCQGSDNSTGQAGQCPANKPASSQACNTQACPVAEQEPEPEPTQEAAAPAVNLFWNVGDWSTCSAECDGGEQTRTVQCMDDAGHVASDSQCHETKPISNQNCNTQACASGDPKPEQHPSEQATSPDPQLAAIILSKTTAAPEETISGEVLLVHAATSEITISLSSKNPDVVTVPNTTIQIPVGQDKVEFQVQTTNRTGESMITAIFEQQSRDIVLNVMQPQETGEVSAPTIKTVSMSVLSGTGPGQNSQVVPPTVRSITLSTLTGSGPGLENQVAPPTVRSITLSPLTGTGPGLDN